MHSCFSRTKQLLFLVLHLQQRRNLRRRRPVEALIPCAMTWNLLRARQCINFPFRLKKEQLVLPLLMLRHLRSNEHHLRARFPSCALVLVITQPVAATVAAAAAAVPTTFQKKCLSTGHRILLGSAASVGCELTTHLHRLSKVVRAWRLRLPLQQCFRARLTCIG